MVPRSDFNILARWVDIFLFFILGFWVIFPKWLSDSTPMIINWNSDVPCFGNNLILWCLNARMCPSTSEKCFVSHNKVGFGIPIAMEPHSKKWPVSANETRLHPRLLCQWPHLYPTRYSVQYFIYFDRSITLISVSYVSSLSTPPIGRRFQSTSTVNCRLSRMALFRLHHDLHSNSNMALFILGHHPRDGYNKSEGSDVTHELLI